MHTQRCASLQTVLEEHKHAHLKMGTRTLITLSIHCATGRLHSIPLKVLWAVISKTIPWMAALIENNEGHIEHMVAVVSPFPLLLSFSLSLTLSLTPPKQKVRSNFAMKRN